MNVAPTEVEVLGFEDWRLVEDWSKPTNPYRYRWQEQFQEGKLLIRAPDDAIYVGKLQVRDQRGADKRGDVINKDDDPRPGMRYLWLDAPAGLSVAPSPFHFHSLVLGRKGHAEDDWRPDAVLRADVGYSRKYQIWKSRVPPNSRIQRERELDLRGDWHFRQSSPRHHRARLDLSFSEAAPPAEEDGTSIYSIDCQAFLSDGSDPEEPPMTQFSATWNIPGAKFKTVPASAPCAPGAAELHFTPPAESMGYYWFGAVGKAHGFEAGRTELEDWRSPGIWQSFELSPNHQSGARATFDVRLADGNDEGRLRYLDLLFNTAPDPSGGCGIRRHFAAGTGAGLMDDQGQVSRFAKVRDGEPLENDRCAVERDTSRTTFSVRFKSGFEGKKNVYVRTTDKSGKAQEWKQVGTWTVNDNEAPNLISASPYQGRGRSATFSFVVSDPNGAEDIRSVEGLFSRGPSLEEACRFEFDL
ncbi:MAG: hypothetical protein GY953_55340, partial [bacterium]|nr:hypothetical protein [bacterium]